MEISLLSKDSLKIKGKHSVFAVDPSKLSGDKGLYSAAIALNRLASEFAIQSDTVVIDSPGEYEAGGIKMNATRGDAGIIFNPIVDGVEIILGRLSTFEKMQSKLKEQHIVVVYVDSVMNASFITSLASNVIIFYGGAVGEMVQSLGQAPAKHVSKYAITLDKLPQEVETIILE